jgi:hypothetical protein
LHELQEKVQGFLVIQAVQICRRFYRRYVFWAKAMDVVRSIAKAQEKTGQNEQDKETKG